MQPVSRSVGCPVCGARVPWNASSPYRPFCSERCRLIDLGQWASEGYRIPQSQSEPPDEPADQDD